MLMLCGQSEHGKGGGRTTLHCLTRASDRGVTHCSAYKHGHEGAFDASEPHGVVCASRRESRISWTVGVGGERGGGGRRTLCPQTAEVGLLDPLRYDVGLASGDVLLWKDADSLNGARVSGGAIEVGGERRGGEKEEEGGAEHERRAHGTTLVLV